MAYCSSFVSYLLEKKKHFRSWSLGLLPIWWSSDSTFSTNAGPYTPSVVLCVFICIRQVSSIYTSFALSLAALTVFSRYPPFLGFFCTWDAIILELSCPPIYLECNLVHSEDFSVFPTILLHSTHKSRPAATILDTCHLMKSVDAKQANCTPKLYESYATQEEWTITDTTGLNVTL